MASNQPSRPSNSPPSTARSSRNSSISGQQPYRPTVPSGLRQIQMPPPSPDDSRSHHPEFQIDGIHPASRDYAEADMDSGASATDVNGVVQGPSQPPDARTRLLGDGHKYHLPDCGHEDCNHGSLSPRPRYQRGYGSFATYDTFDSTRSREGGNGYGSQGGLGHAMTDGLVGASNKKDTTHWLGRKHGVRHERLMYAMIFPPIRSTSILSISVALIPRVGISYITSPSRIGSGNIAGRTSKATS